jgi:hypothetical protein
LIENLEAPDDEVFSSEWALITSNAEFLTDEEVTQAITPWLAPESGEDNEVVWTDDYINLLSLLND